MKTILFFDRANLTKLYGELDSFNGENYRIMHLAYSVDEQTLLQDRFKVPADRILNFKNMFSEFENKFSTADEGLLSIIDKEIIEQTNGRFCLNAMIQSDRAMAYKTYVQSLVIAQICYRVWESIFEQIKPDFIFHESVSLFMNAIASVLARKNSCLYAGFYQTYGFNDVNFTFDTYDSGSPVFLNKDLLADREKCREFLNEFRAKKMSAMLAESIIFKQPSRLKYFVDSQKTKLRRLIKPNPYATKLCDYIDNYLVNIDTPTAHYENLKKYKTVKWEKFNENDKYYYYPLHLEPEASVYYGGDGLYENQIKLLQNIAAQLPPNTYLYVKDHPHDIGYRSVDDYTKLTRIPNIKLLPANYSGQELIKHSVGVITINGTTGFEALLMGKPVFYFGKPPYASCKGAFYVKNIKDLRTILYENKNYVCKDDDILDFLRQWFYWSLPGNITYFLSPYDSDESNTKIVKQSFETFLGRF